MSNTVTDQEEIVALWLRAAVTQLAEALDTSETGVDVDDGTAVEVGDVIVVDREQMLVTAISTNTWTVTRGYNGTTAATHDDNTEVHAFDEARFRLSGLLQPQGLDRLAPKITIGDYGKDSNDLLSSWIVSDLTGGHGVKVHKEGVTDNRYRFGTLNTRFGTGIFKPFGIYAATLGTGALYPIGQMAEAGTYATYITSGDTLYEGTTSRGTIGGVPDDKAVVFSGTGADPILYIPCGNNGYSAYNAVSNTLRDVASPEMVSFCVWADKLIAIDNDGYLYYAITGTAAADTTWVNFTLGPNNVRLDAAYEPKLLRAFYDRKGNEVPYVVTDQNVWAFDPDVPMLRRVPDFESPHPQFGAAAEVWRGELHVAAGMDLLAFNGEVIRNVGFTRATDEGLPYYWQGYIRDLAPGQHGLYALVSGAAISGTRYHSVHEWSGYGWHCIKTASEDDLDGPTRIMVTKSNRIVWGVGGDGLYYYQDLPDSLMDPATANEVVGDTFVGDFTTTTTVLGDDYYTTTYTLETGKFNAGMKGYRKIACAIEIDVPDKFSSSEQFNLYYRCDFDTTWTRLNTSNIGTGMTKLQFGHLDAFGSYTGLDFEDIELKIEVVDIIPVTGYLQSTNVFHIDSLVFSFLKVTNPSQAWTATVDLRTDYMGRSPETMLGVLNELRASRWFWSMRHRDQEYRVRLSGFRGFEESGQDTRGTYQITLVEIPSVLGVSND